jgi:hypothetical protein
MARHLAVPAATLDRLMQKQQRRRPVAPASGEGAPAPAATARPLALQPGDLELLACVLASPKLAEGLDPAGIGDAAPEVVELLAWAAEGVALGRATGPEVMRYLMARAEERAALRTLLSDAHQRGAKTTEPAAVLAGLVAGRRRRASESRRRAVRQQMQQALAVGDAARAAELQNELLNGLRDVLPRRPST